MEGEVALSTPYVKDLFVCYPLGVDKRHSRILLIVVIFNAELEGFVDLEEFRGGEKMRVLWDSGLLWWIVLDHSL